MGKALTSARCFSGLLLLALGFKKPGSLGQTGLPFPLRGKVFGVTVVPGLKTVAKHTELIFVVAELKSDSKPGLLGSFEYCIHLAGGFRLKAAGLASLIQTSHAISTSMGHWQGSGWTRVGPTTSLNKFEHARMEARPKSSELAASFPPAWSSRFTGARVA